MKNTVLISLLFALSGCSSGARALSEEDTNVAGSTVVPSSTGGSSSGGKTGTSIEAVGGSSNTSTSTGGASSSDVGGSVGLGGSTGTDTDTTTTNTDTTTTTDPVVVCTEGSVQCAGDTVLTCTNNAWTATRECTFVCRTDVAVTPSSFCSGVCEPGTIRCNGDNVQTCNENGWWATTQACAGTCQNNACTDSCTPGVSQCSGQNAVSCSSDAEWVTTTCPYVCSAGACTGVCTPGAQDCSGDVPRTCNAQGQWESAASCGVGLCSAGVCRTCVPGATRCNGAGTQTCNASGSWGTVTACSAGTNEVASCSAGVCSTSCNAGYLNCSSTPGCESSSSSLNSCGACGVVCPATVSNGVGICTISGCKASCNDGWTDYDGNISNGCEINLNTDENNCGSVGKVCYLSTCSAGECTAKVDLVGQEVGMKSALDWNTKTFGDEYVYYTVGNSLKRTPTSVWSPTEVLTHSLYNPAVGVDYESVIVRGSDLYLLKSGTLYKATVGANVLTSVATNLPSPAKFDIAGNYILATATTGTTTSRDTQSRTPTIITTVHWYNMVSGVTGSVQLDNTYGKWVSKWSTINDTVYFTRLLQGVTSYSSSSCYISPLNVEGLVAGTYTGTTISKILWDTATGNMAGTFNGAATRITVLPYASSDGSMAYVLNGGSLYSAATNGTVYASTVPAASTVGSNYSMGIIGSLFFTSNGKINLTTGSVKTILSDPLLYISRANATYAWVVKDGALYRIQHI